MSCPLRSSISHLRDANRLNIFEHLADVACVALSTYPPHPAGIIRALLDLNNSRDVSLRGTPVARRQDGTLAVINLLRLRGPCRTQANCR